MKHLKLLFSWLMDPFIYLNLLFSWVFSEDEGHPVDTRQGLSKLQNNHFAKSRKDLTTKALSPSWAIPPLTFCTLDNQALNQEVASPTSGFPEGEFKALYSLTEDSSGVSYRPEPSCPNNISACIHLLTDIRDTNPSAEALTELKYRSFLHKPLLLFHWLYPASSLPLALKTSPLSPIAGRRFQTLVYNILPCLSPFTQLD